MPKIPRFEIS